MSNVDTIMLVGKVYTFHMAMLMCTIQIDVAMLLEAIINNVKGCHDTVGISTLDSD